MTHRKEKILNDLKDVMSDLSGLDRDKIADQLTFLDLGFDSLFLAQMSAAFKKKFGVNVTFRQLLEETPSPEALADYINSHLPPEEPPIPEPQPSIIPTKLIPPSQPISDLQPVGRSLQSFSASPPLIENLNNGKLRNSAVLFERVMSQQLQVMAKQLDMLRYCQTSESQATQTPMLVNGGNGHGVASPADGQKAESAGPPFVTQSVAREEPAQVSQFGPWKPIDKSDSRSLDPQQRRHLDDLIERYTRRTPKSKELTAAHRSHLADPRVIAGFRSEWKEMVYPIVSVRSFGSKLWDVDGNEYVDMMMSFGPALFGHSPDFVVRALEDQIESGIEIGPQSPLAGKLARLICDFTGMERVTFCNTGSEAVLAALRVARTVTGRNKIALFAGSYHGIFDEVLVRPITTRDGRKPIPAAPGIPPQMVQDVIVLRYGDPDSLELVKRHADELAAILVEPVQSRNPDLQPREFLQELRGLTAQSGIALIFDEVITGFRLHAGGSQAWFGVQADLATYGKALGGGMPIGALAGKARFMDALDGGAWSYGDNSVPEVGVTYFAGTFVRHPLAIAAASAVLHHLKQAGPQLYQTLNQRASRLAKELNQHLEERDVPIHIQQCGSLFCVSFTQETRFSSLLFFHLREKGVHIWEGRPTFISTAHSDDDLALVVRAMKESVEEMQEAGFFPSAGARRTVTELKPADSSDPGPCTSSTTPDEFPLTEAQMEIWLATRLGNEASQAFNENILLQFKGTLNLDAMRLAVQRAVNRHDALRTTFSHDGSYQRVNPPSAIDIPLIDLSQIDDSNRKARFDDLITRELQQPFDLVNGPLVRVSVLRLKAEEHFLLITAHHLVCDGWSIHVLLSDLSALYHPAGNAKDVDLPKSTPLREYAAWQVKQQSSPEGLATERYWLDRFNGPVTTVKLPTDHPRRPFRTFNGSCERVTIEKALHTGMRQLGASQGCTAFTTFLAAFKVLLHRLTAQEDIVVGIALAGQSMIGIDTLVGHCVNTLPLRNRIDPNQPFTEFLKSANRSFLDAYEYQNYTFGTIVRTLNVSRDPSQTPLISVMFNMDQELKGLSFRDLEFELQPDPNPYVNFELFFNLFEKQDSLILECEYNTDLFDATTIRRWIGHYENLLREILSAPNQLISALPLMSEAEQHQLLIEWNRTERPYPKNKCIHELFEAQAEESPAATAVVYENRQVTYRELNRRANQLAHHLRGLGVGPDVLVGICMERSLEMAVALLGILKAGGAYVPLDPAYPKVRLAFMLADTQARVLLTQERLLEKLPDHTAHMVCLDKNWEEIAQQEDGNPNSGATTENLSYVIYTSGSTGQPKGVEVSHRGVLRLLFGVDYVRLDATQTFLQLAPISFDASTFEIWGALLHGGKCVLFPGNIPSPDELGDILYKHQVSTLWLTAALFNTVIDENPAALSGVRQLLIGGEALSVSHVQRALALLPQTQIINGYGPTESTTFACCYPIPRQLDETTGSIPIGRPIANTQVYILDSDLMPAPVGLPGELYLGGDGLARGYLDHPELTAERFVRNPFSDRQDARLYKTGDLARYRTDGNIEFLGRMDHQVKIHGFRIELGEIEAVLKQHAAIHDTAVIVREDTAGDKRLVAYVVAKTGATAHESDLGVYLKQKLPQYMIPAAFVFLDSLPLTPNGKLDRRALPEPDSARREDHSGYVAPRTEVEQVLAQIWAEVLRVERVGIYDNFFDLGGHSLLAVRVVQSIEKRIARSVRMADIFQSPTVEQLSRLLHNNEPAAPWSSLVPLQTNGFKPPFFWVHGEVSNAYLPRYLDAEQPLYGLNHQSTDGQRALYTRVEDIATHYLEEILTVQRRGPYRFGGNCFGGLVAFEMAKQLQERGQKVDLLMLLNPAYGELGHSSNPSSGKSFLRNNVPRCVQAFQSARHQDARYLIKGLKNLIVYEVSSVIGAGKRLIQKVVYKTYLWLGFPIPVSLRSRYILEIYARATKSYTVKVYSGDMILFFGHDYPQHLRMDWSKRSTGSVRMHNLPGDHVGVLDDINVKVWAERLASYLESLEDGQTSLKRAVG